MKKTFYLIVFTALLMAPLAAQTVTVTSPNGNESWVLGTPHNITWNFSNAGSATVNITLRNSGGKVGDIKTGFALSAGSWEWKNVGKLENGTMAAPGTDYKVRINIVGYNTRDDSDNNFSITGTAAAPTLQLLSPNGGENWSRGLTQNITWKAENWTGTVQLSLYRDNVFKGVIVSGQASSAGTYSWKVGTTSHGLAEFGGGYRVSVSRTYAGPQIPQFALVDKSDGDFSISMQKFAEAITMKTAKLAKTVSLPPSVANKWYRKHSWTGFSSESAPTPDPAPQMRTGYANSHQHPGGSVDWESWRYIYRGILQFDFSQVKGEVKEAKLSLQCTGTDSTDGTPYCDGSVLVLDGPGDGFSNPYHPYVDLPAQGGNVSNSLINVSGPNIVIVVTDLVKAWISGQQPNHGLAFLGNNETMDDNSNDRCISHFKVALSVTYVPD
jgi:hypothetical protein